MQGLDLVLFIPPAKIAGARLQYSPPYVLLWAVSLKTGEMPFLLLRTDNMVFLENPKRLEVLPYKINYSAFSDQFRPAKHPAKEPPERKIKVPSPVPQGVIFKKALGGYPERITGRKKKTDRIFSVSFY